MSGTPVSDRPDTADSSVRPFHVTLGSVFGIAVPATIGYMTVPLVGIVDTAVIGQLGDAALLGGIAVGAILIDLMFSALYFLRAATTALTAQALGRNDPDEIGLVLWRAMVIALASAVFFLVINSPFVSLATTLMGTSDAVSAATRDYFTIRVAGAIPTLINMVILGWFLGLGRAGTGLFLQSLLNLANVGLTILFVLGLGWGVKGAALGTVVAEVLAAVVGIGLFIHTQKAAWRPAAEKIFIRAKYRALLALNSDILIRSLLLVGAFALFTAFSARFGDTVLAANAVLEKFLMVAGYGLDGFAVAAEQLVGRAVGARYRPAFDRAVKLTTVCGFILAGLVTAVFLLTGPLLVDLMTTSPEVRETAYQYVFWAALTPVAGALAFQMDGVFIGAAWSKDMRNMMLVSFLFYLAGLFTIVPLAGNTGLWICLLMLLGMRGITLSLICARRRRTAFGPLRQAA